MRRVHTPRASPLESHLGYWLRFVSNHVSSRFENVLADHDISVAEWVAMRSLYDRTDGNLINAGVESYAVDYRTGTSGRRQGCLLSGQIFNGRSWPTSVLRDRPISIQSGIAADE